MGWLFGKKDDALYRGDAPASSPGFDGVQPSAYQGSAAGRPYTSGAVAAPNPYPTVSAPHPYPPFSAPYPTVSAGGNQPYVQTNPTAPGHPVPGAHGRPASTGIPPELAAAMAYAQNQQRAIKRTLTRSLFGFLVPLVLVGGLVVVGFVVVDKMPDAVDNPFSFGGAPEAPYVGVVGTAGEVTLGENSYSITIEEATAQPSAAWGSYASAASGGFLVIRLSLTRTDTAAAVNQISWYDWQFTPESGAALEGQLLAGGYEPLLSTLNLTTGESAAGLVAFDTTASVGTLSLTTYDGTWAQWPITAVAPGVASGGLGAPIHPEAALIPFTLTVANPRWVGAGDPAVVFDPSSRSMLVLDVNVTVDEGALGSTSSPSVGYSNWQFVPEGGMPVEADLGVNGPSYLTFIAGQPTTASTLIGFDSVPSPGTLNLINADGSVLATWVIPIP